MPMQMSAQNSKPVGVPFQPGQSGNPGGMPKGVRALQAKILLAHGENVIPALQRLFEMGFDDAINEKTRVAALAAFCAKVGDLTGVSRVGGKEDAEGDAGKLEDAAFWDRVLANPSVRETVLRVIQGGKGE